MTIGLIAMTRHRPTPGILYVGAVGAFTVLVLALAVSGLVGPLAVVVVAVPLGPIGVAAAGLVLPALLAPPSLAFAAIVLAAALAIAVVNVILAVLLSFAASRRLTDMRTNAMLR